MSNTEPLIDTSEMNESEQQLVELFERRATSSSPDDGALNSAEGLTEPTGTPSSEADPTAPEPAPPVEGQAVGSETEPSPVTEPDTSTVIPPPDSSSVEGEPTVDEPVLPSAAFTFAGVDYGPDELSQAVQIRNWYQHLNQPQIQAIDALLSGAYRLVPAHEADPVAPHVQQTASSPATSPAPSSPASPVVDDGAGEWLDPRAQAEVSRLQAELNQIREQFNGAVTPLVQSQADSQLQARLQSIDTAHTVFRDEYHLTDAQMESLGQAVVQANIFPSLVQRHNGNVETATRAALDMMLWTTPTLRDELIKRQVTDLATESQQPATIEKQKKLTSLANSGGSVPRRDVTPQTREDRHSAMVEMIRADLNGQ